MLLDEIGRPLSIDIASGQTAEAWAQTTNLDPTDDQFFPAFLVQVRAEEAEEDSIEGQLTDLEGDVLTLLDDGVETRRKSTEAMGTRFTTTPGHGAYTDNSMSAPAIRAVRLLLKYLSGMSPGRQ